MRRSFVLPAGFGLLAATLLACGTTTPVRPTPSIAMQPTAPATAIPTAQGSPTPVPDAPTPAESGVFRVVLVMTDGTNPLPVVLRDVTGLVSGITVPQPGVPPFDEGVTNPDGQTSVLRYGWVGGACDTATSITLERKGAAFAVTASTTVAGGVCRAVGLFRSIDIHLVAPIDAKSVTVTGR